MSQYSNAHDADPIYGPEDSIEPKSFEWDDAAEGCRSIVVACLLGALCWFFVAALFAAAL